MATLGWGGAVGVAIAETPRSPGLGGGATAAHLSHRRGTVMGSQGNRRKICRCHRDRDQPRSPGSHRRIARHVGRCRRHVPGLGDAPA